VKDWLDEDAFQNGIRIDYASESINPRLANRKNLILIRTFEHLICYDLDKEQQVDYLLHTSQLANRNHDFVDPSYNVQ